jgi:hypothetical protein
MEWTKRLFKSRVRETDDPVELRRRIKTNAKIAYALVAIVIVQSLAFAFYLTVNG